jgi:superfamily II DNA or RNA helicase
MPDINLRNYQLKTISTLRNNIKLGFKKLIMCAPTGAG